MTQPSSPEWTQQDAIGLCKVVEGICPKFGCHVALTGGLLYKEGNRKDCDLLFYRIRQVDRIDHEQLFEALEKIGMKFVSGFGWCVKFAYEGRRVDCFFPEEIEGEYTPE